MGLFSFLFGGKKKAKTEARPPVTQAAAVTPPPLAAAQPSAPPPPAIPAGVMQAKLRLKLAASLRTGEHAAAYEAARGLADIQIRAGRKTVARVWQQQADRIRETLSA